MESGATKQERSQIQQGDEWRSGTHSACRGPHPQGTLSVKMGNKVSTAICEQGSRQSGEVEAVGLGGPPEVLGVEDGKKRKAR